MKYTDDNDQWDKFVRELDTNEYLNNFHKTNNELILEIYNIKLERYEKLKIYYKVLTNCLYNRYRTSEVVQSFTRVICSNIIDFVKELMHDIFCLYDNLSTLNEKNEKVWIFKEEDNWNYRKQYKLENEKKILNECKKILDILLSGKIYFKRNDENNTKKKQLRICRKVINDISQKLSVFLTYYYHENNKEIWYLLYPDEDYMYYYELYRTK